MKRLERFCLRGCAYTVLLLSIFYLFAALSGTVGQFMPTGRFFLIMLFGFIISLAELIYEKINLKFFLRGLIHYAILLCCFFIVFVISGNLQIKGAGTVFAAFFLFTALYFAIYAIVHFSGKGIRKLDDKLDKREKTEKNPQKNSKNSSYTPRFEDKS